MSPQRGRADVDVELSPRRRQILDAATTVLSRQGNRGLTHRAVDRQAGLPEGSTSAYFRTRAALLGALGALVAGRLTADVAALSTHLAACSGDHDRAVEEVSGLFSAWLADPDLLAARLELTLAGSRDPELAQLAASWREELVELVGGVVRDQGTATTVSAATLVAALDGVLLAALLQPEERRAAFAAASVEQLLASIDPDTSPT